ncbi:hypothetical protein L9F63_004215, partial [Diploptera punctata]
DTLPRIPVQTSSFSIPGPRTFGGPPLLHSSIHLNFGRSWARRLTDKVTFTMNSGVVIGKDIFCL